MFIMASSNTGVCERCNQPEDKQNHPVFQCQTCSKIVHLSCIENTPSPFVGDVLFEFTCSACSPNKENRFSRNKMAWAYVIILTLHHLHSTSQGIGNRGFFHYKTHIAGFVDKNWNTLFGLQFKQKKAWIGTLVGALSFYSGTLFESSASVIGELGWWRLKYRCSPALAVHVIQEMVKDKALLAKAKRSKSSKQVPVRTIEEIFTEAGYAYLLYEDQDDMSAVPETENSEFNQNEGFILNTSFEENMSQDLRHLAVPFNKVILSTSIPSYKTIYESVPSQSASALAGEVSFKKRRMDSVDNSIHSYQSNDNDTPNSNSSYDYPDDRLGTSFRSETCDDSSSFVDNYTPTITKGGRLQEMSTNYDTDSRSESPYPAEQHYTNEIKYFGHREKEKPEPTKLEPNVTSLFSKEPNSLVQLPWLKPITNPDKNLMRLTEYEEIHLLKSIEAMIPNVKNYADRTYLRRLRAKLALRRLKRNKHLPLFDLDNTVKYLAGYSTEDPRLNDITKERVLDRYQSMYNIFETGNSIPATILVGSTDFGTFQSPHSGTILKPFIRRDSEANPLWLRLTDELLLKANKNNPHYTLRPRAPIDYSYVKPQHIAAVNNLCAQFYWPGIDVSESLQYPEFSCVVTYKKVLIAFAFLVPDTGHNTAYIPFILTRPEWRRAGIATFMLYHLLQTCLGQDVTLHVSPTNPAVFLYQKFGFKVEELVQDFYEKYYDINDKTCKHAVLLRLSR